MVRGATLPDRGSGGRGASSDADGPAPSQNGLWAPPGWKTGRAWAAIPNWAGSWPPAAALLVAVPSGCRGPLASESTADGRRLHAGLRSPRRAPPYLKERAAGAYLNAIAQRRHPRRSAWPWALARAKGSPGAATSPTSTCASTPDYHHLTTTTSRSWLGLQDGETGSFPPCRQARARRSSRTPQGQAQAETPRRPRSPWHEWPWLAGPLLSAWDTASPGVCLRWVGARTAMGSRLKGSPRRERAGGACGCVRRSGQRGFRGDLREAGTGLRSQAGEARGPRGQRTPRPKREADCRPAGEPWRRKNPPLQRLSPMSQARRTQPAPRDFPQRYLQGLPPPQT